MTGECQLYMVIASPKAAKGHQAWAEGGTKMRFLPMRKIDLFVLKPRRERNVVDIAEFGYPGSVGSYTQSAEVAEWGGI